MDNIEIKSLENEIQILEDLLLSKKEQLHELKSKAKILSNSQTTELAPEEITRYSRQIIMPHIKLKGQIALKNSKVLIVGAGGLGCPASLYLAAAGVGAIHIMDYDEVELSNLHRQILHYENDVGGSKVKSLTNKLRQLNSNIVIEPYYTCASDTIVANMENNNYDVVIDCSDNVPTRYLLNDVCVLYNVPLVSGSALQLEGQLTVYHYKNGPCYRCLFPTPPPAHTVTSCGDGGVLGTVPGTIGVLQALEAIKIIINSDGVLSRRLLLFDASTTNFRTVKLRERSPNCDVCGDNPTIKSPINYEQFCGSKANDKVIDIDLLESDEHISPVKLNEILQYIDNNVVIDVRPYLEYEMCKLPNTVNIPYSMIQNGKALDELDKVVKSKNNVFLLCRRGNDSQRSVEFLKKRFPDYSNKFFNVNGGFHAYSRLVDSNFPVY